MLILLFALACSTAAPEATSPAVTPVPAPAEAATADWCEEHALPESQCLKCNPELKIERPPKQGG